MNLDKYQKSIIPLAQYPNVGNNLIYPTLGLNGESGEVCDRVKKIQRDHSGEITKQQRELLIKELGDVMWYVAAICNEMNFNLKEIHKKTEIKNYGNIHSKSLELNWYASEIGFLILEFQKQTFNEIPNLISHYLNMIVLKICEIAQILNISLRQICQINIDKLNDRHLRGVIKGDGNSR